MSRVVAGPGGAENLFEAEVLSAIVAAGVASGDDRKFVVKVDTGDGIAKVTFRGTGFAAPDANGFPTEGLLKSINITIGGVDYFTVSDFGEAPMSEALAFFYAADADGLNDALYGDDDLFVGGTESDRFEGMDDNDTFDMRIANTVEEGDQIFGGAGNDKFLYGTVYDNTMVSIDGGTGNDTLTLAGDYPDLFIGNLQSVEKVRLEDGFDYDIVLAGDLGSKFTVDGSSLGSLHSLAADGGATPSVTLTGGGGDDDLRGGNGKDVLRGGGGQDFLEGRLGNDVFAYGAVSESTGSAFDTISFLSCHRGDKIDLPIVVQGSSDDEHIIVPVLDHATFNEDMAAGVPALEAFNFARVTALSGDYAGQLFIVIDCNGTTGYQGGQDMVIALDNPEQIERLGPEDFM